jgi:thiamine biosynthesis protein ThiS
MKVIVNGEEQTLDDKTTVEDLIEQLGLATAICAAEVNKTLVPREKRAETPLRDGDVVEVVTLVGGG